MEKSSENILREVIVRPILRDERDRWQALMKEHHYLGFSGFVGERIEYVAEVSGRWVALLGWAAAALKISVRDRFIGWNSQVQSQRLKYVSNNVRYLILPGETVPNLASRVLALNLKRLNQDYLAFYGHPVLLAETFIDSSRNLGTCYLAQGWEFLGETKGFGRKANGYITHGSKKRVLVKLLCEDAIFRLSDPFREPVLGRERVMTINYKKLPIEGRGGLMDELKKVKDPRSPRGSQHPFICILAIAICALLSGCRSYQAIADWAENLTNNEKKKFFCRKGTPSESTFRKTLQRIGAEKLDKILSKWLLKQNGFLEQITGRIALDGKTVRGSHDGGKKGVHLLSAFLHEQQVVITQKEVSDKTNEIPELKNLLNPLPIKGALVTADAMHTQSDSAAFIVREKEADFMFTVKDNQPKLKAQLENSLGNQAFSPSGT